MKEFKVSYKKFINSGQLWKEITECEELTNVNFLRINVEEPISVFIFYYKEQDQQMNATERRVLNDKVEFHVAQPIEVEDELNIDLGIHTMDGKLLSLDNSRPLLTKGYFSGRDDSVVDPFDRGGGSSKVFINHIAGDGKLSKVVEMRFNTYYNDSWLFQGYIEYVTAKFDEISFEIRPMVSTCNPSKGSNFYMAPNGVIIPANGWGNVSLNLDSEYIYPIECIPRTDNGERPPGFWDCEFDPAENKFVNFTPRPAGDGIYNLFGEEYLFKRHINNWQMLGTNKHAFETKDASRLGTNLRLIFIFNTFVDEENGLNDHDWAAAINVSMFREKA